MRENDFLTWVREQTPVHERVPVNVGDDMAVVRTRGAGGEVLLKIDQCLDLVHFDLRKHSAMEAGRKAVKRCLSDCAGMGCAPSAIMISVALPREGPGSGEAFAQEMFLGCREAAAKFDCPLVGGDTAMWDQRLVITVAAMGEAMDGAPVLRSGAKVGDTLFVSGELGGSILGRHLQFEPRVGLGRKLVKAVGAGKGGLHAMMDLSDGLAQDLPRMCAASGVGAEVHAGRLPVHEDAWKLSEQDGMPAGLHALADGEDYELLFAIDPEMVPEIIGIDNVPLTAIGVVTEGSALVLVSDKGSRMAWPRGGWEHRS